MTLNANPITNGQTAPNGARVDSSWPQWSQFVLQELKRLNQAFERLDKCYNELNTKMTVFELREADHKTEQVDFKQMQQDFRVRVLPHIEDADANRKTMREGVAKVLVGVGVPSILAFLAWLLYLYHQHPLPNVK